MKTIFTIFIFSFFVFNSKAQWIELDPGVDEILYDVYAITPDIVVVVGANGTILKTTDGGETWLQKFSGTTSGLGQVEFPTPEIGYVIGGDGTLLKTTDSGETWIIIDFGNSVILNSLSFINEDSVFISAIISGSGNRLYKTVDGGDTWIYMEGNLPDEIQIQFLNEEIGFAGGYYWGDFARTLDGGESWQEMEAGFAPFQFTNQNTGFCYDGDLMKTIDGGETFFYIGNGDWIGGLEDLFMLNENAIWGIMGGLLDGDGSTRGILKMNLSDIGDYSEEIAWDGSPETEMYSIHFADETTGYVTGRKNGVPKIWKNGTGINVLATKDEPLEVFKVYPNPASKEINIEIPNIDAKTISVSIIDLNGKQIYSDSFNNKKVKINTEQFPKGVYILSVETDQKKHSQKIIIN